MAEMLAGKVALVSGIGPGLGIEIARLYAREGADVVMGARRTEVMEPLAAEIEAMGRRTVWQSTDITDPAQCQALADAAVEELGRLDVCVNNAFNDGFPIVNVENADLDRWRNVIDVNFFGSLNMTRACIPALRDSGAGRIIFINTMSIRMRQAGWGAYSSSKAALENITKILAKELGPDGIRVNSVLPGYIFADAVRNFLQGQADARGVDYQVVYDETAGETALKYLPDAAEIAGAALFFASDLSLPITGASLDVNAGHWIGGA